MESERRISEGKQKLEGQIDPGRLKEQRKRKMIKKEKDRRNRDKKKNERRGERKRKKGNIGTKPLLYLLSFFFRLLSLPASQKGVNEVTDV